MMAERVGVFQIPSRIRCISDTLAPTLSGVGGWRFRRFSSAFVCSLSFAFLADQMSHEMSPVTKHRTRSQERRAPRTPLPLVETRGERPNMNQRRPVSTRENESLHPERLRATANVTVTE
jgi:hypothetical protein